MKHGSQLSPETRAEISRDTKLRMADPAVRQRIRDGMLAASGDLAALQALRIAWEIASERVRQRFLDELLKPVVGGAALRAKELAALRISETEAKRHSDDPSDACNTGDWAS